MSSKIKKRWQTEEVPEAILEAWSTHEAFRRLGFSSDEIFFGANRPAKMGLTPILKHEPGFTVCVSEANYWQVVCVLKTHGREFVVTCGWMPKRISHKKILSIWSDFVERFNAGKLEDGYLQGVWEKSAVKNTAFELVAALLRADIVPPRNLS